MSTTAPHPTQISPLPPPARLLTTHDANGQAVFASTGPPPWQSSSPSLAMTLLYSAQTPTPTFSADADLHAHAALVASDDPIPLVIPHGHGCRIVDMAPLSVSRSQDGGSGADATPFMHRTQSLDYGIVVSGEVEMALDGGEKRVMRPGDVAVQRGTMHSWRNVSETEWVRMVFVMMQSEEIVVGGKVLPATA